MDFWYRGFDAESRSTKFDLKISYIVWVAGIIELFHGRTEDDPQTCFVLAQVPSKEAMDKFFENAGEEVAKSGHILESTEVTMLTN